MSRLAEAQTQIVSEQLAADPVLAELAQQHPDELVRQLSERFAQLLPELEWLIAYAWRRHMLAAVQRAVAGAARDLTNHTCAIGFCDIVGYTRAVRDMTTEDLSELVATFEEVTSDIVVSHDGRVVKTLGDEVMFTIIDRVAWPQPGLELAEAFGDERDERAAGTGRARLRPDRGARRRHLRPGRQPRQPLHRHRPARDGGVRSGAGRALETAAVDGRKLGFSVTRMRTVRVRGYAHLAPYLIRRA